MPLLLGAIVAWAGEIQDIPSGWALCDGVNGTPDLRNKFIVGAGDKYNVGNEGGSEDSVLIQHNHTGSTNTAGAHTHNVLVGRDFLEQVQQAPASPTGTIPVPTTGNHTHTATVNPAGVGETGVGKNMPPYYALAYIMQIS